MSINARVSKDAASEARAAAENILALALDRNFGETHGGLAVVAALQGRRAEAEVAIRRAQGLNAQGLSGAFAQMLLGRDVHHPEKLAEEVHALVAQQQAPFGGSVADLIQKINLP